MNDESRPIGAAPESSARTTTEQSTYAASAAALLATGLGSPLPLPPGQKFPPPTGWTGETAPYASETHVAGWAAERPDANIGLRLGPDVIGIDVDAHKGPQALETMASFEAAHGPLPRTWISSARPAPSGIRWYRLPEGTTSADLGDLGPGVELIRAGHRYAVVPPSRHPLGDFYAWRRFPDGTPSVTPPMHRDLPVLTTVQVEGMRAHRTNTARRATPSPATLTAASPASPEVPEALRARVKSYAQQTYAGLVADAQALAALPEGERLPHAGELVGWESGLGKHLVLRALQLDAATWHGGAPGTFVAAVRGVSSDPAWTGLVDEKAAAKSRIAEPAPMPRFVTEHDPADPFGGGYAAQPATMAPTTSGRTRPSLRVGRPADMLTWARENLGTGATADVLRRGTLVRIPRLGDPDYAEPSRVGDDDGPAKILTLRTPGQVSALLSARFELYAVGEERRRALFPAAAARELVDAPDLVPSVRELAGVTHAPIVRADGSVLSTPGYDAATRLAYLPERGLVVPPVPELPTSAQVAAAVDLLMFMISGFRFLSDSDRANYLGALLTPLLRALAPPPYKLLALGAPMPGSGKTLLAELLRIVHGAVLRGEMPLGDELPKELTTILATTTAPVVVFDNVTGVLRSSKLSALLTSGVYESRILGVNEQINVPNDRLWVVTGNNLALGGDLPRRTLSVTIDPGVPDPHMRSGFTIPDLRGWTRAHRGELLHALLVLVRSWHGVGRPVPAPVSDNYETWRQTVGGILTHAGVPGDFDAPSTAPEAVGADDSEWAEFLAVIERVFGPDPWTAAELLAKVDPSSHYGSELGVAGFPIKLEDLPAELAEKMRGQTGPRALARPLGMWLRNRAGRWAGGRCVRPLGLDRQDTRAWRIEVFQR